METNAFGTIQIEDGQATLPVGPGLLQPAALDVLATVKDREAMAAAASFIDALPRHLDDVRARVMEVFDTNPECFTGLFPCVADPARASVESLWQSLVVRSVWTRDDATVIVEFAVDGAADTTVLSALFDLDGTLSELVFAD